MIFSELSRCSKGPVQLCMGAIPALLDRKFSLQDLTSRPASFFTLSNEEDLATWFKALPTMVSLRMSIGKGPSFSNLEMADNNAPSVEDSLSYTVLCDLISTVSATGVCFSASSADAASAHFNCVSLSGRDAGEFRADVLLPKSSSAVLSEHLADSARAHAICAS